MLWIVVFGLMGALFVLFQRLQAAERRIEELEDKHSEHTWRILALASAGRRDVDEDVPAAPEPPVKAVPDTLEEDEPEVVLAPSVTLRSSAGEAVTADVGDLPSEASDTAPIEPPSEPEPEPETVRPSFDFEEIFGRKLPIWAGGITLAVAGVFLVRYSIEAGLLTPLVRVALSFLFGIGLLGAAEAAYRFEDRVQDERVRQALAGAGLATLYAAFYLAGTQYELIGQTLAFLGLASVTAFAIFLSYRFGLPSAILGLVGGLAAPALVGGEDANLPMLALYLALVTGGLAHTGNRQGRSWLGMSALAGGLGWGALILLGSDYAFADILALGVYFVLLGTLIPALLEVKGQQQLIRLGAAGAAGLQLAVLVDKAGYQPLAWGLYLLLGAALAWFGWRQPAMRAGSAMAAAIGIALLALWPVGAQESQSFFVIIAGALVLLFAYVPLALLRFRDGAGLEALMVAGASLALGIAFYATLEFALLDSSTALALGVTAFSIAPALAAWVLYPREAQGELSANLTSAGLLAALASNLALPDPYVPIALSVIALGMVFVLRNRMAQSVALTAVPWLFAGLAAAALAATATSANEFDALAEGVAEVSLLSILRWAMIALPFAAIAVVNTDNNSRSPGELLTGAFVFGALAQVLPPIALVWVSAALVAAIGLRFTGWSFAALSLLFAMLTWAIIPTGEWLEQAVMSLGGEPMLVPFLPDMRALFGFIAPLAVALGFATIRIPNLSDAPVRLFWAALPLAVIIAHTLFKQVFELDSRPDFAALGLAERTVWQALLLAGGWAAWKVLKSPTLAWALAITSLAHFLWYTGLLHNPLWAHQAVGPAPIANLVLAAYGVGIGALVSLRLWWPDLRRGIDIGIMALALVGAISLLRQMFAGTFLDEVPMSQAEDLLRSLVGILLAIAFLLIGSARGERLWRVGSLVLMTATVLKVFIFDTAGLEGLLRIASFVALGASLIGIGWFYSRQLKAAPTEQ